MKEILVILDKLKSDRNFDGLINKFEKSTTLREDLICVIQQKMAYPYAEYASWFLIHLTKRNRDFSQKKYKELVDVLFITSNQSVLRNVLCSIDQLQIQEYRESEFLDLLVRFVLDKSNKVALHVYSIHILIQFVKKYPELKSEIDEVLKIQVEGASPAYFSAVKNYNRAVNKIK